MHSSCTRIDSTSRSQIPHPNLYTGTHSLYSSSRRAVMLAPYRRDRPDKSTPDTLPPDRHSKPVTVQVDPRYLTSRLRQVLEACHCTRHREEQPRSSKSQVYRDRFNYSIPAAILGLSPSRRVPITCIVLRVTAMRCAHPV